MTPRFIILEPSKVGTQHWTLIKPYIEVAAQLNEAPVEVWCHKSMWQNLPSTLRSRVFHRSVPVVDPSKRWFFRKVALEIILTLWVLLRKRPSDTVLVTCLLSPALFFVTMVCRVFRPRNFYVVLHGELEALADRHISPGLKGYGFWIRWFWKLAPDGKSPSFIVIDKFIRDNLLDLPNCAVPSHRIHVLTMPIEVRDRDVEVADDRSSGKPAVCFIGYRSRLKGFELFSRLAAQRNEFEWLAIGGGSVENMATGEINSLNDVEDYLQALTRCQVAIFPYEAGYDLSMSAAALDAISCELHLIATARGCFRALSNALGTDVVQCADGLQEIGKALDLWLENRRQIPLPNIKRRIGASRYSIDQLKSEMRDLICASNPS